MSTDTAGAIDLDIDAAPYDSEMKRPASEPPPAPPKPRQKKERKQPKGLPGTNRRHAPKRTLESALSRRINASSSCAYEASIISSLDRRIVPGFGTFGVEFVGARPTLYVDPDYMAAMSDHELDVTLKHEVMHLTLHHPVRGAMLRRRFDFDSADMREKELQVRAHRLATDWAVNELLITEEPLMASENKVLGYWALPREHGFPAKLSYEEYFPLALKMLRKKREEREKKQAEAEEAARAAGAPSIVVMLLQGDGAGAGEETKPGGGEEPKPGAGGAGESTEDGEEDAPKGRPRPANLDELLEAGAALSQLVAEDEKKLAEANKILEQEDDASEQMLDAVLVGLVPGRPRPGGEDVGEDPLPSEGELEAVTTIILAIAAKTMRGHGKSVPGIYGRTKVTPPPDTLRGSEGLLRALEDVMPSNPTAGSVPSMRSISRPAAARALHYRQKGGAFASLARRMPLFPGVARDVTLTIAIVLDTSGSMTEAMLSYGIGVVRDVIEELGISEGVLLECDDRAVRALRLAPGAELPDEVVGRGGTNFDPGLRGAIEWARENDVVLDALIYITDGDAPKPTVRLDIPTVWAIVGRYTKEVLQDVPGNTNVILKKDF